MMSAVKTNALWLCLYFPQLALEVFATRERERPCAVIEQRRVHCGNRADLAPGLALATAQALHPDLLALERDTARESEWLHGLAEWAYGYTPAVAIGADNSLLLEIGSCRRLYRGIANLLEKLRSDLQRRDHQADIGLAHTPKAAWLLARDARHAALAGDWDALPLRGDRLDKPRLHRQLDALPLALLAVDADIIAALQQTGIDTLGALRQLPLAALGKRHGEAFIHYLQQLLGMKPDPQHCFVPAPRFQRGLTFIDGIHQRSMLLFPMKRLLQALDDYLRARQLHCHTLHWRLYDAHALQAEFPVMLSRTQSGWRHALELSRIKLEALPDIGAKNGDAVFSIALSSADFFAQAPHSDQLFPDAAALRADGHALLDRLSAKLGVDAVQQLQLHADHWPEAACSSRPLADHSDMSSATAPIATPLAARPVWLLPQPQPLQRRRDALYWHGALTLLRGPERIGNHWWQHAEDERDYYIARNTAGSTCWIFCERRTQRWFLHGLFA